VQFDAPPDDGREQEPRSDRLHRKDTPHYKRDLRITDSSKPDAVMALLRNQSMKGGLFASLPGTNKCT